jgi:RNA polymerase sigma-70 factor (ECF subfamily)
MARAAARLRRFALWLTREAGSADDLVQATVERALSRRGQQRWTACGPGCSPSFTGCFSTANAANACIRAGWPGSAAARPRSRWAVTESIVAQADLQAFARLSAEQRALLLLVSVEGLSYKEAAETLGIPIGTVMSRLSRARAALRELTEGNPAPTSLRRLK